ncbi:unnamed protein product [Sympodiomycopsis kandeliae]
MVNLLILMSTLIYRTNIMSQAHRRDQLDSDNPCHPHACALQSCMQKTWNQEKCQEYITDLYRCCNKFYEKYGLEARADGCPLPDPTRKKLQSLGEQPKF